MNFDRIYCINIDERKEKWQQCVDHFNAIGLGSRVERFSAVVPSIKDGVERGVVGCRASHIECIKQAKADGAEYLLLLEDDAEFLIADFKEIDQYLEHLKPYNWQMIYFGGSLTRTKKISRVNEYLIQLHDGCLTTHCYGLHCSAFDIILQRYEEIKDKPIKNPTDCQQYAIDGMYQLLTNEGKLNTYHSASFLCDQRPGFSDIRNGHRDYKIKRCFENIIKKERTFRS